MQDLTFEGFGESFKILLTKKVSSLDRKRSIGNFVSDLESIAIT